VAVFVDVAALRERTAAKILEVGLEADQAVVRFFELRGDVEGLFAPRGLRLGRLLLLLAGLLRPVLDRLDGGAQGVFELGVRRKRTDRLLLLGEGSQLRIQFLFGSFSHALSFSVIACERKSTRGITRP
jgi:hypothetical protein